MWVPLISFRLSVCDLVAKTKKLLNTENFGLKVILKDCRTSVGSTNVGLLAVVLYFRA